MNKLDIDELRQFVNENIVLYHQSRVQTLEELRLDTLLKKKNPYLFKAKNITTAADLITNILEAHQSSSDETSLGTFLEQLAVFIVERTYSGHKSAAEGVDLEFSNNATYYVVTIKSGPNWGNSDAQNKLESNLRNAVARIKQIKKKANVQAVLGICYGKTRTSYLRGYLKIVGQNFWYLLSGDKDLYTDIVEPIGYRAKEHNEQFVIERSRVINKFTKEFVERFCDDKGSIDWKHLIVFNSGNFDLDRFIAE